MAIIVIDRDIRLTNDGDGNIIISRPAFRGKMATYTIKQSGGGYDIYEIARWMDYHYALVQDAFPRMSLEDREFLVSGMTPEAWEAMVGDDK